MKVSALVSAYYAEEFIEKRLENLMSQDIQPEIVVVCKYNSVEHKAAHAAREKYPHVIDITTPDVPTVYEAWNLAIQNASGEYLTNANCDDEIYPGGYAKMARILDKNPMFAVAYANCDVFEHGQMTGRYEWAEGGLDMLCNVGCFIGPMPMWRKSLHDKYGLFDPWYMSAGDYEFWMRIAKGMELFFHIRESLGAYAKRDESVEHRLKLRALWETARARAKYRYDFEKWRPPYDNHEWLHIISGS